MAVLIAVVFVAFGLHDGVPLLRHDWGIPLTPQGWKSFAATLASGWDESGIGSPRPYPTLFLLGPILAGIALSCGSETALGCFLFAIAFAFIVAGAKMAQTQGRSQWFGLALAAAMLFNPWIYEKVVAGHLTMVLSTGVCALLASELLGERPRRWVITLCAFVAAFQIQFALLVVLLSVTVRANHRTIAWTCLGSILSLLPSIVGIVLSNSTLLAIPFTVAWQHVNSVPLLDALLLDGYFAKYTSGSHRVFQFSTAALVLAALAGLWLGFRNPVTRSRIVRVTAALVFIVFYASGFRSGLGWLYGLSLGIRQSLVFRELYDLLGLAIIYYAILAVASAGIRTARYFVAASALGMVVAWLIAPPSHWWVAGRSVPQIVIHSETPNVRFALLPWRQPLRFHGEGSGADPDSYARANNVVPVNQYEDVYPANVALEEFDRFGDTRDLEALSVAEVYRRPYFSTNFETIREAVPVDGPPPRNKSFVRKLKPLPELSIIAVPPISATPAAIRQLFLFDGGEPAEIARDMQVVDAPREYSDPRHGWINAAIIFSAYPDVANALGGAFTLDPKAFLPVPKRSPARALVNVKGKLLSDHGIITTSTVSWKWVALRGATTLSCLGACAVIAWETRPLPSRFATVHDAPAISEKVSFTQILPFAVTGQLPPYRKQYQRMLLFRTRFDSSWLLIGVPSRTHVQVSSVFNGYILSKWRGEPRFVLIEVAAVAQTAAMLFSVVIVILLSMPSTVKQSASEASFLEEQMG